MKKYIFEVEMVNPEDKIDVEIEAESANARDAFFKKFLTDKDEQSFLDTKTGRNFNKNYIYSYKLKGE